MELRFQETTMIMITDDSHLVKLKGAGLTDKQIAEKLGWTEKAVQKRLKKLLKEAEAASATGLQTLYMFINGFAQQYQLLGQSLAITTQAVTNTYSREELDQLLNRAKDSLDPAQFILEHAIILKPFVPPSPQELLKLIEQAGKN